jgi:diguanylate cyclase (GGDEF)-like protein
MRIYRLFAALETFRKGWLTAAGIGVVFLLGFMDFATGFELSFSFFYLIPVAMAAWAMGRKAGLAFSVLCASVWLTSNLLSGQTSSSPFIGVWNTLLRFGFYAVVTVLLAELRHTLEEERLLANTDPLTGAMNRRSFNEIAEKKMIVSEVNRKPYTLVYIDLDDFKSINDRRGHAEGDMVLKTVADVLHKQIRQGDLLARLGGDEFAVLLADTGQETAKNIVQRLQKALLEKMKFHEWEITFSFGVLTFLTMPVSVDQMVSLTNALMHEAKTGDKNAVRYSVHT